MNQSKVSPYMQSNPSGWRPWLYNDQVDEFYVIIDDFTKHRKSNSTKEIDEVDLGESWCVQSTTLL